MYMSAPVLLNLLHSWGNKIKFQACQAFYQFYYMAFPDVMIFRDYLMVFWLWPEVSTRDPIIIPRALALRLIMVEG